MFINVKNDKGVYCDFPNKPFRINLSLVNMVTFSERNMVLKNGRPISRFDPTKHIDNTEYEQEIVKIINLSKWQPNTNFKTEDITVFFTKKGNDEFVRIKEFIEKITI